MTQPQATPRRFWSRRRKRRAVLLGVVVLCVGCYCYRDKPLNLAQTTEIDRAANPKTGEVVDYRYAYNALQDAALSPVEENGWRTILQTFGPIALDRYRFANEIPWEELPTNNESKEWFDGEWTRLCEKFKIDPHERPKAWGRLAFWEYLSKYGLTGEEPEPVLETNSDGESKFPFGTYWERCEERPSKIDVAKALTTLQSALWTAEEYPVPARWFDENADIFETVARAARSPRFGCWIFLAEPSEGGFLAWGNSSIFWTRHFSRLLAIRARYRVASGDVSGAIDDVETATLLARAILDSEYLSLSERLIGRAALCDALGVPLYGNVAVLPTYEENARISALWRSFYDAGRTERRLQLAKKGERLFCCGVFLDALTSRRQGQLVGKNFIGACPVGDYERPFLQKALLRLLFSAPPTNDAAALQCFQDIFDASWDMSEEEFDAFLSEKTALATFLVSSSEKKLAVATAADLLRPGERIKDIFRGRVECALKESTLVAALQAYRAEHGTFPPAFTLSASGRPLHSWRVLILPYLGDDAKALYGQIRLDESWNSSHNAAFHAQIPDVFRCPATDLKDCETRFSVLLGDDGFFDDSGVGKDPKEMAKLPSRDVARQFLVVERPDPVCWMKPDAELKIADFIADGAADPDKFLANAPHSGDCDHVELSYARFDGVADLLYDGVAPEELESRLRGLPDPKLKSAPISGESSEE